MRYRSIRRHSMLVLLLSALLVSGCSGPLTKVAPMPPPGSVLTREGKGAACGVNLMGVIPILVNSRAERAYNQAVERAGATGLTDTKVTDRWSYIFVGARFCTYVEGMGFRPGPDAP
jgi:hypothetical protein